MLGQNFEKNVTQETDKGEGLPKAGNDYDDFILRKVNEVSVIFRPKSGAEDRVLQVRCSCMKNWSWFQSGG